MASSTRCAGFLRRNVDFGLLRAPGSVCGAKYTGSESAFRERPGIGEDSKLMQTDNRTSRMPLEEVLSAIAQLPDVWHLAGSVSMPVLRAISGMSGANPFDIPWRRVPARRRC